MWLFVLAALLVSPCSGTFLYSDKITGAKTHMLPVGDPTAMLARGWIVTRRTSGVLGGLLGAQHGQLILEPIDRSCLWAVDLHTIRDPKKPEVRLDLAEIWIVRTPWVDVPSSDFYNAKDMLSEAEQAAKLAANPTWAPRGILKEVVFDSPPSERAMLSFTRAFHRHFAYLYSKRTYNCQVFTASLLVWLAGGREMVELDDWIADTDNPMLSGHLISPPSKEELRTVYRAADMRETALDSGSLETAYCENTNSVDTLDKIDAATCSFADRSLPVGVATFPTTIEVEAHQLGSATHGDTVMFRAWELQLHHIGSAFEYTSDPLVFRGDLSYVKRSFTAAEHALLFGQGKTGSSQSGAQRTGVSLGPFAVDLDLGGTLGRYVLNPERAGGSIAEIHPAGYHREQLVGDERGLSLLRLLAFGRKVDPGGVVLNERQRFTYGLDDDQMYIATSGHVDSTTVPLGKLGLMSKKFSFDTFSKHNMFAGSSKALRYAGELTVINLSKQQSDGVETWSEEDEYRLIVDNNSGSFAPDWPSEGLEAVLRCNFPEVPGRFSLEVIHGPNGANLQQQEHYCGIWGAVDDIPPYTGCMTSLVGVLPSPDRHVCCGKIGVFGETKNIHGICSFVYMSETGSCPSDGWAKLSDSCCAGGMVGIEQPCADATCAAHLQPAPTSTLQHLNPTLALHGATGPSKQQECLARQWRTRSFECLWTHQLGSPTSDRAIRWINSLRDTFRSNAAAVQQFADYLDHIDRTENGALCVEHFRSSPLGDLTFGDEEILLCTLPFLRNHFTYVPLSMKFKQFIKDGVYDPEVGAIPAAKMEKIVSQYRQWVTGAPDYKNEPYKTGMDGFDDCPDHPTLPRAEDEWGNPKGETLEPRPKPLPIVESLTAEQVAALPLRPRFGSYELMCSAAIDDTTFEYGGFMVTKIGDQPTHELTYDDVMRRISGGGMVTFERVDPSFCRPWCPDRSPIDGSDKWPRCMWTLHMYSCGKFCCCATNYEFHAEASRPFGRGMITSSLGSGNCLKCDEDKGDPLPMQYGVDIALEQADRDSSAENGTLPMPTAETSLLMYEAGGTVDPAEPVEEGEPPEGAAAMAMALAVGIAAAGAAASAGSEPELELELELEPEPEPEPEPRQMRVQLQVAGKGPFHELMLEVRDRAPTVSWRNVLVFSVTGTPGDHERTAKMASMSLSTPKHAREGHELAVRVDLSEPDTAGATKYVIAVESEAELAQLRQLLNEELIVGWMWADAGLVPSGVTGALARANPLRWTKGTVPEMLEELSNTDAATQKRGVRLKAESRRLEVKTENVLEAIQWLRALR